MASHDVLAFLGALQDLRELVFELAQSCNRQGILALAAGAGPGLPNSEPHEITSDMLLIAKLCYHQDISQPAFQNLGPVTDLGRLALQLVGAVLLGMTVADERQLLNALAVSTVQNVVAARQLCLTALQASVSPSNCFRLYHFADQCGISPLRHVAEQVCLQTVPHGNELSSPPTDSGFALLDEDQLQRLLQSDQLQVCSELDVFGAICLWAQSGPQERLRRVADLVSRCVRLGAMDLEQLEQLDQDPRVVASPDVTRVVAQAYIMRILGAASASSSSPCVSRPRDSVARMQAAARQCGDGAQTAGTCQLAVAAAAAGVDAAWGAAAGVAPHYQHLPAASGMALGH